MVPQRRLVHADANRPDRSLAAELIEGRVGAVECLFRVVVRVVDECDVDAIGTQPPQAAPSVTRGLQQARIRYYDAARRRRGLPASVGALVVAGPLLVLSSPPSR